MKRNCFALVVSVCLAAGCATTDIQLAPADGAQDDLSSYRDVVLTVHGLSCPLCSNNLDGQLRRIEGVNEASIDLKTGAVSVRLAEGHSVTRGDLAKAVEDAGFTLRKIEPQGAGQ